MKKLPPNTSADTPTLSADIRRATGELARAASHRPIVGPRDLKAAVEGLARQFGLRPALVWAEVEKRTETGKLLAALLRASEVLASRRRRNPQREEAIMYAVDSLRISSSEDDFPGYLPAGVWATAAKKLSEQDPPILGRGRMPKLMEGASVRKAYRRAKEQMASLHFFEMD